MFLSNRTVKGAINGGENVLNLKPGSNDVIVGFYGKSTKDSFNGVAEFGIITAPKDVGLDVLPEAAFDLPELRNSAGLEDEEQEGGEEEEDD